MEKQPFQGKNNSSRACFHWKKHPHKNKKHVALRPLALPWLRSQRWIPTDLSLTLSKTKRDTFVHFEDLHDPSLCYSRGRIPRPACLRSLTDIQISATVCRAPVVPSGRAAGAGGATRRHSKASFLAAADDHCTRPRAIIRH